MRARPHLSNLLARLRAATRTRRFAASFLIACAIAWGMEVVAEHAVPPGSPYRPSVEPSMFDLDDVYRRVVGSGPRKPSPQYTSLVVLDPDTDPSVFHVCEQRGFLAEVIRATASLRPAVIAIDKYFVDTCRRDPGGTQELVAALRDVAGQGVRVVVGRRISKETERRRGGATGRALPTLLPAFPFGPDVGVREGIVNVDPDTRRLPLGWTVVGDGGAVAWRPTLALAAAEAFDPMLRERFPLVERFISRRENPYVSFMKQDDLARFATHSARDVLCATRPDDACAGRAAADLSTVTNRVAIIAERSTDLDSHHSVVGEVPGFVLQANYIEALLDRRYFRPAPSWANYAAGFLMFLSFHWILISHERALERTPRRWRALVVLKALWWGVVTVGTAATVVYLVVTHTGWYLNPITMGALAFVMSFGDLVITAIAHEGKASHDERAEAAGAGGARGSRTV